MFHSKEKTLLISSGSPPTIWALISLGSAGLEPGLSGAEPCSLSGDCFPIVDNRDACLSGCGAQMRSAMKGLCRLWVILIGLQVQLTWLKHNPPGISLVVKWLTLSAPTAEVTSSIPCWGTRSYMPCSMPPPKKKATQLAVPPHSSSSSPWWTVIPKSLCPSSLAQLRPGLDGDTSLLPLPLRTVPPPQVHTFPPSWLLHGPLLRIKSKTSGLTRGFPAQLSAQPLASLPFSLQASSQHV